MASKATKYAPNVTHWSLSTSFWLSTYLRVECPPYDSSDPTALPQQNCWVQHISSNMPPSSHERPPTMLCLQLASVPATRCGRPEAPEPVVSIYLVSRWFLPSTHHQLGVLEPYSRKTKARTTIKTSLWWSPFPKLMSQLPEISRPRHQRAREGEREPSILARSRSPLHHPLELLVISSVRFVASICQ